jgi:predicted DNA-binding WGR domain protein
MENYVHPAEGAATKFWKWKLDKSTNTTTVIFGSVKETGRQQSKTHSSLPEAEAYIGKTIKAKLKKGYALCPPDNSPLSKRKPAIPTSSNEHKTAKAKSTTKDSKKEQPIAYFCRDPSPLYSHWDHWWRECGTGPNSGKSKELFTSQVPDLIFNLIGDLDPYLQGPACKDIELITALDS